MSLGPGTRLGPYEVQSALGAGGMGEVYKAKDGRLDRVVAIKVLPAHVVGDPELRQRFEREAKTLAALSHPHICAVFDVGRQDGVDFLVMEYLEGQTLAERLQKGALPLDQLLRCAVEIADALDKAHRKGIVHRDLKPGNIMLTKGGAKLLDFGLAKLQPADTVAGISMAATLSSPLTGQGTILGTLQYMAPEQVEGKEADARSDIFALGAIVYEMATGKKAFQGGSTASLIAAILERDPPPLSTLQPMSPSALEILVATCLAKDPEKRWSSAHDVMLQLARIAEAGWQEQSTAPARRSRLRERAWMSMAAVLLATTVGLSLTYLLRPSTDAPPIQFFISPPDGTSLAPGPAAPQVAVSPEGRQVAYATVDLSGNRQLWIRSLDALTAQAMPGTEGAEFPFWAPDSRFVGFFAQGKLKTVDAAGGPPTTVCDASAGQGGSWNRDGVIVFAPSFNSPLAQVPAAGGEPVAVTSLDQAREETGHLWPQFLPDGRHFLYLAQSQQREQHGIYVGSLDGGEPLRVLSSDVRAGYAPPGYLLFVREGTLMAQPFDASRLALAGEPARLAEGVATNPLTTGRSTFATSETGVLAYRPGNIGGVEPSRLLWFDRGGNQIGAIGPPGLYADLHLSPDGTRLAVYQRTTGAEAGDVWLFDLRRGTSSRFTLDPQDDGVPVWSPDGAQIVFGSGGYGRMDLYLKSTGGATPPELLLQSPADKWPLAWSTDGRFILFQSQDAKTGWDLWLLPLAGDRVPMPLVQTRFNEQEAEFSPDGRWLAYSSDESGRLEVYVQPFGSPGGRLQISPGGGGEPMWRRDGRELFYLAADRRLMAVEVRGTTTFEAGMPRPLFQVRVSDVPFRNQYQVSADGQRFLVATVANLDAASRIAVVLNWPALLKP